VLTTQTLNYSLPWSSSSNIWSFRILKRRAIRCSIKVRLKLWTLKWMTQVIFP